MKIIDEKALYKKVTCETWEELKSAAEREANVCGDQLRTAEGMGWIGIYNWHQGEIRWEGVVG